MKIPALSPRKEKVGVVRLSSSQVCGEQQVERWEKQTRGCVLCLLLEERHSFSTRKETGELCYACNMHNICIATIIYLVCHYNEKKLFLKEYSAPYVRI